MSMQVPTRPHALRRRPKIPRVHLRPRRRRAAQAALLHARAPVPRIPALPLAPRFRRTSSPLPLPPSSPSPLSSFLFFLFLFDFLLMVLIGLKRPPNLPRHPHRHTPPHLPTPHLPLPRPPHIPHPIPPLRRPLPRTHLRTNLTLDAEPPKTTCPPPCTFRTCCEL